MECNSIKFEFTREWLPGKLVFKSYAWKKKSGRERPTTYEFCLFTIFCVVGLLDNNAHVNCLIRDTFMKSQEYVRS